MSTDLLIVGPASRSTGGVAQYVTEHRRRLPDEFDSRVYDVATPGLSSPRKAVKGVVASILDALRFPVRRPPDIVHIHSSHGFAFYRAAWYVLVAALLWRRPVVFHVHGSSFDDFVASDSRAREAFQSIVFDAVASVIVLSEYWRQELSERVTDSKLVVVPNAVDPSEYSPLYGADPPHLVFVSNHIERKGIVEFVEAVERIRTDGLECRVSIAGSGPLSDHAAGLAAEDEAVEYLGYVPEERKRQLLDAASIYVLPTYAEGLPIALLEGMAGGNAVVTTAVGAIPEVVDESTGRLVPPGDVDELEAALRELIESPTLVEEMGRRNRSLVESEYSWDVTTGRLTSLYRAIVP